MNSIIQTPPGSPSRAGNFIISYESCDHQSLTRQDTDKLLEFIEADTEVNLILANTDNSFFPRAFTDKDLNDFDGLNGQAYQSSSSKIIKPKVIRASDKSIYGAEVGFRKTKMNPAGASNVNFRNVSYQPDIVMTSSNQRPGPDGSPALVPSGSKGFLPSENMSETSELFAPVRQLTFSDIDQNSHVENSYAQRSVSTPTRHGNNISGEIHAINDIEGRDTDNSSDEREPSPEFRQLDGEADSQTEVMGTGAFDPTFMGINREFLDNFTERTTIGRMHLSTNVFSPLSSRDVGFRQESRFGQPNRTITPPLYSPHHENPYNNRSLNNNSPPQSGFHTARASAGQQASDLQELQFSMSPTRNPPDFMPVQYSHRSQDDMYNQYDFHQQFDGPRNNAVPLQIRQSVSIGEERMADSQIVTSSHGLHHNKSSSQRNTEIIGNSNNNSLEQAEKESNNHNNANSDENNQTDSEEEGQVNSNVPPAVFEQRYLQRTQVSVKLPQATYDSLAGDFCAHSAGSYDSGGQHGEHDNEEDWVEHNENPELNNGNCHGDGHVTAAKPEYSEQRQATNKPKAEVNQTDQTDRKGKKQPEKFHIEMKKLAEHPNPVVHSEKSRDLNKNAENTKTKQNIGSLVQGSNVSEPNSKPKTVQSRINGQSQSASAPQSAPVLPPSSRLLQETVSQKNKTTQKFVSNIPQRYGNEQHNNVAKDFKKPSDVNKNAAVPACAGARKTLENNSDKGAKLKIRSTMGTQPQKQQNIIPGASKLNTEAQRGLQRNVPGQSSQQSVLNNSHESTEGEGGDGRRQPVVTQVQKTSPFVDKTKTTSGAQLQFGHNSVDVSGMEDVRHQLQSMLRMSHDNLSGVDYSQYEHSDIVAGYAGDFEAQDIQRPADVSWNFLRKHQDENLAENFPSFSSKLLVDSGNVSRSDVSLQSENQRLRDLLEKERYRRKHCENYIQQLNVKLLETQQQVAVAVSTDKKKDIMIEQLDKQLARVVEGWKKRDGEKDEQLEHAWQEKEEVETKLKQQEQMIGRFEHDMSEAVDALRKEKERSAQTVQELNDKISEAERLKAHAEEMLGAEREKSSILQQECESLREARESLDKKLDQMQKRLHREQDEWFQREQELLQRIEEVNEKNTKILQIERTKNEEQGKLAEEIMEQYQTATTKMKKLELDLDAALREKESMKVEIGIMEAKFENAQRVLEADLQSAMEKQIADQISDVQKRMEKCEDELREKHREQVLELNQRHKQELEKVQSQVREGLQKKEEEFRKQMQELETRLQEYREENSNLKLSKQKLESQRLEILTKLQYMMQSQWNEALTLLSTTPQRRQRNRNREAEAGQSSVTLDDSLQTVQSVPAVNFSLHGTYRPQPQENLAVHSPGKDSVISHSTAKDDDARDEARDIESTAAEHLKEFQEYINSITQTPDWISSLETQDNARLQRVPSPNPLPTPPELAALLQSHLQTIQHQHLISGIVRMPQSQNNQDMPSNRLLQGFSVSESVAGGTSNQNRPHLSHDSETTPPKPGQSFPAGNSNLARNRSDAMKDLKMSLQGFSPIHGEPGRTGAAWDGLVAVPIRPPQQGMDPYQQDSQAVRSSLQRGYFQGGQSFSPPTKQSSHTDSHHHDDSIESIHSQDDQCVRLTEDYSQLSERVEQHQSHQNELQHYIQMLLNKIPTDGEHNESTNSQDITQDLDLNDTAQAAQLQRELNRIQELRRKQEASQKDRGTVQLQAEKEVTESSQGGAEGHSKILNGDQMAEIAKLLNQVKGQADTDSNKPQIDELIEVLRHLQGTPAGGDQRKGPKHSARPGQHVRGDKHKGLAGVKRNVQFQPAKGLDVSRQSESSTKSGKPCHGKKMERKVAGSVASKGEKGSKPAAWK